MVLLVLIVTVFVGWSSGTLCADPTWQSNLCPPTSYLDALDGPSLRGTARLCWERFSSVAPIPMTSRWLEGNLTSMDQHYSRMLLSSGASDPTAFQQSLFSQRVSMAGGWDAYNCLASLFDSLLLSPDCQVVPACGSLLQTFRSSAEANVVRIPIDTSVQLPEGALALTLYCLMLVYTICVIILAWKYFGTMTDLRAKNYVLIICGVLIASILKIVWWSFLLSGVGVQTAISPLAARLVFRIANLVVFYTVSLFLFVWLWAVGALLEWSRWVRYISYAILLAVVVAGTISVIVMGVLAESGGFDCSVAVVFTLELCASLASLVLTLIVLQRMTEGTASSMTSTTQDRLNSLRQLLIVEVLLTAAFLISMVISYYVLFQPPLFAGNAWLQFFAMTCIPDMIVFGALISLSLMTFARLSARASPLGPSRASGMVLKSSSTTMGSYGNDEDSSIPMNYKM